MFFKKIKIFFLFSFSIICGMFFLFPILVKAQRTNDPFLEQWAYSDIGLYEAWNYTTGSKNVIVAIIDNGFDFKHPDLKDNLWYNKGEIADNGIDDDKNGYIDDINGWNFYKNNNEVRTDIENFSSSQFTSGIYNHATYVAGIIGATGNNGIAGSGLNWQVSLMNLKVVDERGIGGLKQIEEAIFYAVNNGAQIINISIVGNDNNEEINLKNAIDYAYEKGVLVVAAAGNDMYNLDENPRYPVCSDEDSNIEKVLGVSAMFNNHHLAFFSNIGKCVDITAPGTDVTSTMFFIKNKKDETKILLENSLDGTSFATPFVSGAAALIKSINLNWTAKDIIEILKTTVHHTLGQDENEYNNLFGYGLLRVDNAVKYAIEKKNEIIKDKMIFIDKTNGKYEKRLSSKIDFGLSQNDIFKNFQTIELTKINDEDRYVLFKKNEKNYEVYLLDSDFNFLGKKILDLQGEWNFTLADVYSTSNPEIVAAPNFSSDIYLKVFNFEGKNIKNYKKEEKHDSAFVKTIKNFSKKDYLSLVFKKNGQTYIEELDKDFGLLNNFSLKDFDFNNFVLTNIDSDYEQEYIFSSKIGDISKIFLVNNQKEYGNFVIYPLKYKQGFSLFLFDYNHDGKEELILTAKTMPNRIYNFTFSLDKIDLNLIAEWKTFADNLFFLPSK
ncbi:MAG: S8 family peptidase [Patescibacteria group bacterium]